MNRLCWNDGGTRIASGSDDKTVCLFDAASGNRDLQFDTGHRRNILGLKILPCTNDQVRHQSNSSIWCCGSKLVLPAERLTPVNLAILPASFFALEPQPSYMCTRVVCHIDPTRKDFI